MTLSANFTSKSVFDSKAVARLPLRQLGFLVSFKIWVHATAHLGDEQ